MQNPYPTETGCCPRFQPEPWDDKEFRWDNKLFIKDHVPCLFHIPLGFGRVVSRNMEKIAAADAFTPEPPLGLSDHTSRWAMDVYFEVTREVPGARNVRLSGTYLSRVFEGPFSQTGAWCRQMAEWAHSRGEQIQKYLMYYTTCPKCAKHYGKNYVVILAQVQA